ncbi:signal peptidase I [Candidatus Parcubacteria bacterium]|nr:signal peptidase I [Candidatus Parcubacteria bacterium]
MALIIFILLIFSFIYLIIAAGVLLWTKKLFKIENPSYKNSFKILIFSGIASFTCGAIFKIVNLSFLSGIFTTIIAFFVFHFFLKKYYQNNWKKSLAIYIVSGTVALAIFSVIIISVRFFIASPFIVKGEAMSPTYISYDYLLINKLDKRFIHGDIVVYCLQEDKNKFLITRIIGLPGEKIEIKDNDLYVNGQFLNEPYANGTTTGNLILTLKKNEYFVLGDNRNKSLDSRVFGPILKEDIEGVVFYKLDGLKK